MTIILFASIVTDIAGRNRENLAYACSCAVSPVSDYIERSSATFTGKVESISGPLITGGHYVEFGNVSRIWGVWSNDFPYDGKITVWTKSLGSGDCGYPFKEGQEYLVYTERHEARNLLEVEMCNGTKPIDSAEAYLQVLGTGTNPAAVVTGGTGERATVVVAGSSPLSNLGLLIFGLPIAAIAIVSFWVLQKRGLIH
jgi:hypothetical protein